MRCATWLHVRLYARTMRSHLYARTMPPHQSSPEPVDEVDYEEKMRLRLAERRSQEGAESSA